MDISKLREEFFKKEVPGYSELQNRSSYERDDQEGTIERHDTFNSSVCS